MEKSNYAKGIYFNPVSPKTTDEVKKWKKGSLSIHIEKLQEYLKTMVADDKGYVRFDLTKNDKDGEVFYSFKLNDWRPEPRTDEVKTNEVESPW